MFQALRQYQVINYILPLSYWVRLLRQYRIYTKCRSNSDPPKTVSLATWLKFTPPLTNTLHVTLELLFASVACTVRISSPSRRLCEEIPICFSTRTSLTLSVMYRIPLAKFTTQTGSCVPLQRNVVFCPIGIVWFIGCSVICEATSKKKKEKKLVIYMHTNNIVKKKKT